MFSPWIHTEKNKAQRWVRSEPPTDWSQNQNEQRTYSQWRSIEATFLCGGIEIGPALMRKEFQRRCSLFKQYNLEAFVMWL